MNWRYATLALTLSVPFGCGDLKDALSGHEGTLAQAAGHRLTVEKAGTILAAAPPRLAPADPEVVRRFADFWIDYTLLAVEMGTPDSIEDLPLEPLIRLQSNQELVWRLREHEILPRVEITDEDLRVAYDSQQAGLLLHAAHILLRLPEDPAKQDSVRQLAESLRARAAQGGDFAALARRHSADPGSGPRGGDLGWFGRGRMVPEFEAAALALDPGEVSPVVQSRFGLHVIKLLERRQRSLDEIGASFRDQVETEKIQALEEAYIDSLTSDAEVRLADGAAISARELARAGSLAHSSRARRREKLATYRGGELTVEEYLHFLSLATPQVRAFFGQEGSDEQVGLGLERLVRDELLLRAATDRGLSLDSAMRDSLQDLGRRRVMSAVRLAGFTHSALASSDTTIDRNVEQLLVAAVQGRRALSPLGPVGLVLRERHPHRVRTERLPDAVRRVGEIRAARDSAAPGTGPTDTAGAGPAGPEAARPNR